MEIVESIGFEEIKVVASRPSIPSRATVNISSSASRSDAAASAHDTQRAIRPRRDPGLGQHSQRIQLAGRLVI
jgi:hypothetical protein